MLLLDLMCYVEKKALSAAINILPEAILLLKYKNDHNPENWKPGSSWRDWWCRSNYLSMCEKFVLLHFKNALKILGMVSPCFSQMSSQQFNELPNSTNAVESYNRFGRSVHRQPLKVAMMASYQEDMAKSFEIMARGRGLLTSYEDQTPTGRNKRSKQQNSARKKRLRYTDDVDNTMGPPDKRANFISGNTVNTHIHTVCIFWYWKFTHIYFVQNRLLKNKLQHKQVIHVCQYINITNFSIHAY